MEEKARDWWRIRIDGDGKDFPFWGILFLFGDSLVAEREDGDDGERTEHCEISRDTISTIFNTPDGGIHLRSLVLPLIYIYSPNYPSKMLSQRLALRPLVSLPRLLSGARTFRAGFPRDPPDPGYPVYTEENDPGMNGGYVNPPPQKSQYRDPYGDWWDKQGRRNFGEPLHEDDDILGRFTPEEYTWTTPKKGLVMVGTFALAVLGFCGVVYNFYPDKPAVPRRFPHDGLVEALGGPGALPALSDREE